jgi:hypothetical protein
MTGSIASKKVKNLKKSNSRRRRGGAEMLNKLCKEGERKKNWKKEEQLQGIAATGGEQKSWNEKG